MNSTHPDYDANIVAWQRARDVFAGEDAVKSAAEKYLPRLDCQDDKEYLAYKNRASFFNASARTADGFVGLIFRRDPTFKLPDAGTGVGDALAEFVEDADMLGTSLTAFSKKLVTEIIGVGRAGTLIDFLVDGQGERLLHQRLPDQHQIVRAWKVFAERLIVTGLGGPVAPSGVKWPVMYIFK